MSLKFRFWHRAPVIRPERPLKPIATGGRETFVSQEPYRK